MKVRLGQLFSRQLRQLSKDIKLWGEGGQKELKRRYRVIGQRVKSEAQKRVPVKTNRLKQDIRTVTFEEPGGGLVTEVGTSVKSKRGAPYPVFLEFGTKHIAGGRVKALGQGIEITDAQAIKDWPAKAQRGARRQQMPWLRTAWHVVKDEAIEMIDVAMKPPKQGRG